MSLRYSASIALSLLAYGAFAAALAAKFKHPVLWGFAICDGMGNGFTAVEYMPMGIKRLSISHYLFTLFPNYRMRRGLISDFLGESPPSIWIALLVLSLLTVGLLWLAIRIFREREYLM